MTTTACLLITTHTAAVAVAFCPCAAFPACRWRQRQQRDAQRDARSDRCVGDGDDWRRRLLVVHASGRAVGSSSAAALVAFSSIPRDERAGRRASGAVASAASRRRQRFQGHASDRAPPPLLTRRLVHRHRCRHRRCWPVAPPDTVRVQSRRALDYRLSPFAAAPVDSPCSVVVVVTVLFAATRRVFRSRSGRVTCRSVSRPID